MSDSTDRLLLILLGVVAVTAVVALALAALALQGSNSRRRGRTSPLPTDLAGLRGEVERLREESAGSMRHLSVVRYDAFGDMGGRLSWSLAMTDSGGDGIVLTSIHGRTEARTYAKNLAAWSCDQQLSPEEVEAVSRARSN